MIAAARRELTMDVRLITDHGVRTCAAADLPELLQRGEGVIWVDLPGCAPDDGQVLAEVFGFHPMAIRDCIQRNRVPRLHTYRDHAFLILHAPEFGESGHIHYVELDQFIAERYLVTVHGPVNPAVAPEAALRETSAALRRIELGKLRPRSGSDLSYAIVSAMAVHQEAFIEVLTKDVWRLEQRVTGGHMGDAEQFLEEMFRARHGLLAVRTIAALTGEVYGRMATLARGVPDAAKPLIADLIDQYERVQRIADGEKDYLQGVIEFYQTRTETKMTIAAERLAVIAALTLPITALSSVLGMNLIVNNATHYTLLGVTLAVMGAMSALLLVWAKRQGWW
jgi:Mg2+ and Co2+ transporter CorA